MQVWLEPKLPSHTSWSAEQSKLYTRCFLQWRFCLNVLWCSDIPRFYGERWRNNYLPIYFPIRARRREKPTTIDEVPCKLVVPNGGLPPPAYWFYVRALSPEDAQNAWLWSFFLLVHFVGSSILTFVTPLNISLAGSIIFPYMCYLLSNPIQNMRACGKTGGRRTWWLTKIVERPCFKIYFNWNPVVFNKYNENTRDTMVEPNFLLLTTVVSDNAQSHKYIFS